METDKVRRGLGQGMGKGRLACVLIRYRGGGPAVLSVADSELTYSWWWSAVWIVLSNVVAVSALMWLIHVDQLACRHVLLYVDIAITTTCLRPGTECRRVSARQWISEYELVFERHPHEQVFVTTPWTTLCHLLHTHARA